jgi:hypothetical protein
MKISVIALVAMFSANSATAGTECSAADAATSTVFGAGVGAAAGVGAVWTLGVLAAPFTLGGSLVTAAAVTGPAIALGAKGGAFYGASSELIDCGKAAKDAVFDGGR